MLKYYNEFLNEYYLSSKEKETIKMLSGNDKFKKSEYADNMIKKRSKKINKIGLVGGVVAGIGALAFNKYRSTQSYKIAKQIVVLKDVPVEEQETKIKYYTKMYTLKELKNMLTELKS